MLTRVAHLSPALLLVCLASAACEKAKVDDGSRTEPTVVSVPVSKVAPPPPASVPPPVRPPTPPAPPALSAIPAPDDVAAAPADAAKTASGLASKVLTKGTGKDHPGPEDQVKCHYTGWTKDGKMFDSSVARGEPASFRLNQVIKGWTEGLQLMVTGEKRRLWIPGAMAYGNGPSVGGRPTGDLVFDVELLSFTSAPKPPSVPEDVKGPPPSAKKTASGLAYRVLKPSKSKESPKDTQSVTVNYSGWTTDGKMFDSSITRGEPTSFPLKGVIKGWTEGLQLMHVGETVRFWIPADLAYGDRPKRPGAPSGMLVFDIELLAIK